MKIGIIGAGNIGGNLARRFTAVGHEVRIANSRGPETLTDLAAETGATATTVDEVAHGVSVLVVTIPMKDIPKLTPAVLAGADPGLVVIDTCNYYPKERDGRIDAIEAGQPESLWVQQHLDHPVVKVFNGIYADHLVTRVKAQGEAGRIALPVAGDDGAAKGVVMALVDEIGFDGVDAGSLADSWKQQPNTPVYGADADVQGVRDLLAKATPERTAAFTA